VPEGVDESRPRAILRLLRRRNGSLQRRRRLLSLWRWLRDLLWRLGGSRPGEQQHTHGDA
jgi:hypothetical protein